MIFDKNRRKRAALRYAFSAFTVELVIDKPSSQIAFNQSEHPLILHFVAKEGHQKIMINAVKEFLQININGITSPRFDDALNLFHRLLPISIWPEPKTVV